MAVESSWVWWCWHVESNSQGRLQPKKLKQTLQPLKALSTSELREAESLA